MSLVDMMAASQLTAAIESIRFDRTITGFEFKPSIGIAARRFSELAEELADLREPLIKSVDEVMTISILENFMSSGRPRWEELSKATLERRRKENAGSMILVRSGALAETASSRGVWSIGRSAAVIKGLPQNVWYGLLHQGGYEGDDTAAGNWFKKYQDAARKVLGPEASNREVDQEANRIAHRRTMTHGPAPRTAPSIPARPFVMFQDEDIDAIENIFIDWLEEKIREAGLR